MFEIYFYHKDFGKVTQTIIRGKKEAMKRLIELNESEEIDYFLKPYQE